MKSLADVERRNLITYAVAYILYLVLFSIIRFLHTDWLNQNGINIDSLDIISICILYMSIVVLFRWQLVARPFRQRLEITLRALDFEVLNNYTAQQEQPETRTERRHAIRQIEQILYTPDLVSVMFWTRTKEAHIWELMDALEIDLARDWSLPRLKRGVQSIAQSMARLKLEDAAHYGEEFKKLIESNMEQPALQEELLALFRLGMILRRKSLEPLNEEYDRRQNKLLWFIAMSLIMICLILNVMPYVVSTAATVFSASNRSGKALFAEYATLMVAGAAGGTVSRLTAAFGQTDAQSEAKLRWLPLFLSPLVGALTAWTGFHLLQMLQIIKPSAPELHIVLSYCFLLGFSERLLPDLANKAQDTTALKEPARTPATTSPVTTPATHPAAGAAASASAAQSNPPTAPASAAATPQSVAVMETPSLNTPAITSKPETVTSTPEMEPQPAG